jgi:alkylation response protein AidB-like acyl-CoA dehydrogenase
MANPYPFGESGARWLARAADLAARVLAPNAARIDAEATFPEEAVAALRAEGFLGLCIPAEAGGAGEGPATFAAVVEELAKACSSTAMIYVMHVVAAQVVVQSSTLRDRDAILAAMAKGEHLTTLAFSEKGSRSQFWAPVSKLTVDGDGFRTSAYKSWVTTAHHADSYVSSAQKPGAAAPMESTLYLVRKGAAGVRIDGGFDGLGLRGNDSAPVAIEDLRVEAGDLLTPNGEGANGMLGVVLPWFTVGTAAMAHGLCLASITATSGHLAGTGFSHSGQDLRDLPNLRARIAQMSVQTEQARALLGYTLRQMAEGADSAPLFVLRTRAASLQAAVDVTDLGMKACGGAAFSKHLPLERLFRDARAGWVMAPTVDHVHDFVGKALTGLPLF